MLLILLFHALEIEHFFRSIVVDKFVNIVVLTFSSKKFAC